MSQVIGPCYMQQRLLICPCYVDSVPERTTLAEEDTEPDFKSDTVYSITYHVTESMYIEVDYVVLSLNLVSLHGDHCKCAI